MHLLLHSCTSSDSLVRQGSSFVVVVAVAITIIGSIVGYECFDSEYRYDQGSFVSGKITKEEVQSFLKDCLQRSLMVRDLKIGFDEGTLSGG